MDQALEIGENNMPSIGLASRSTKWRDKFERENFKLALLEFKKSHIIHLSADKTLILSMINQVEVVVRISCHVILLTIAHSFEILVN